MPPKISFPIAKTEQQWRAVLSPEQFAVLRNKHTERPGTGQYLNNKATGIYSCAGCDSPIYRSSTKFDSHCGWPAFYQALPGAVQLIKDESHGMVRTEMVCSKCGGHLGHVFYDEGFDNPTNERHCANSVSLSFKEEK